MNFRAVTYVLGWILNIEGALMLPSFFIGLGYDEPQRYSFLIMALVCFAVGTTLVQTKPRNLTFFTREGYAVTALSWIIMSVAGCMPFVINGDIPSFTNALFETISGFTTTGTSILDNVEACSHASLFWRSFTHWIGGMGVLVFLLALIPMTGGTPINIMRAESPGPSVDKLVPKVRRTAFMLYAIYVVLTIVQIILLLAGKMPAFDAFTVTFATAGTGGFAIKADSMAGYSPYIQWVTGIFMMLFGVNFGFYFLLLMRKFRQALGVDEVRNYVLVIVGATVIILLSMISAGACSELPVGDKIRHAFFQVSSIITTTGFVTYDFDKWPELAKTVIIALMFIGACAGSTGGGIKVSRISILLKTVKKETALLFRPNRVLIIKNEGKEVPHETLRATNVFLVVYMFIYAVSLLVVSLDGFDFLTNFTAIATTLNNVGPGLGQAGPTESFAAFSGLSKYVMMFDMLAGRLEIYPMLILFAPEFWKNVVHPSRGMRGFSG